MKIFLLGLPGSGKTTLGKQLSEALRLPFVDLDFAIEQGAGEKITEIFKEKGEDYFRELESAELKKWCFDQEGFVMATGGGTPCFNDNMKWINESGKSIFLDVPARAIARRIKKAEMLERPLLASLRPEELKDYIEFLRSSRIPYYGQAHISLPGDSISLADLTAKLKPQGN